MLYFDYEQYVQYERLFKVSFISGAQYFLVILRSLVNLCAHVSRKFNINTSVIESMP